MSELGGGVAPSNGFLRASTGKLTSVKLAALGDVLSGNEIILVPAQGVRTVIIPLGVYAVYENTGAVFASNFSEIDVGYDLVAAAGGFMARQVNAFADQVQSQIAIENRVLLGTTMFPAQLANAANLPVSLSNGSGVAWAGGAGSTIEVILDYFILNF